MEDTLGIFPGFSSTFPVCGKEVLMGCVSELPGDWSVVLPSDGLDKGVSSLTDVPLLSGDVVMLSLSGIVSSVSFFFASSFAAALCLASFS